MTTNDLLIELGCEELPAKPLKMLSDNFTAVIRQGLVQASLNFTDIIAYATPRRLAVKVVELAAKQTDRQVEKRGPALTAAFDATGQMTKACEGFLRSVQASADQLTQRDNYVWVQVQETGQTIQALLPAILMQAITQLPIPKRMRWGAANIEFIRPVHWVLVLYGHEVVPVNLLGKTADRYTYGHRFHHPQAIMIHHPDDYETALETACVSVSFAKRRAQIQQQLQAVARAQQGQVVMNEALLDEVTALVEWPVVLCGKFDPAFLTVPPEALISSMETHQKSFALVNQKHELLPCFLTVSNINSQNADKVIEGNERVMRARLADAQFFYETDLKQALSDYVPRLKTVVFQTQLGSLHDKVLRIAKLAHFIADQIGANAPLTERAAMLCKADLLTSMVGEFPELQGIAGFYYASQTGETAETALAIKEHYLPRFAKDELPTTLSGCAVAIADRIDTLIAIFGINKIPTGEKDPFALRRAALGSLRIIIEHGLNLDLQQLLAVAAEQFPALPNSNTVEHVFDFMLERLRAWYQERGLPAEVFAAVAANKPTQPLDFHQRVNAVNHFMQLPEATALAAANKRVSRLLQKEVDHPVSRVNPVLLKEPAEKQLAEQLEILADKVLPLYQNKHYAETLLSLAALRQPIDQFFEQVMVMVEDKALQQNRLAILQRLRQLFLLVADISLLQGI